jgi:hypothetical protein
VKFGVPLSKKLNWCGLICKTAHYVEPKRRWRIFIKDRSGCITRKTIKQPSSVSVRFSTPTDECTVASLIVRSLIKKMTKAQNRRTRTTTVADWQQLDNHSSKERRANRNIRWRCRRQSALSCCHSYSEWCICTGCFKICPGDRVWSKKLHLRTWSPGALQGHFWNIL